jgi:CMP/dCMP kinase
LKSSQKSYPRIIAIDGPAASGKSTIGQRLAEALSYLYFDTGVMYRAVTLAVIQKKIDLLDEEQISHLAQHVKIDVLPPSKKDGRMYDVILDGEDVTWDLRQPDVEAAVSPVSTYSGVRKAMTEQQRRIGLRGQVVMMGRDIGTVVLPDADIKFYLEASVEERARRRTLELKERGKKVEYQGILAGLKERDRIDSTRKVAPLKPADDAIVILTDSKNQDQVLGEIMEKIRLFSSNP